MCRRPDRHHGNPERRAAVIKCIRREVVMTPHNQDEEYESYARDCVRLANLTSDQFIREKLMEMARQWMAASMREAKPPRPTKRSELT